MANTNAPIVTNVLASSTTINEAGSFGGRLRVATDTLELSWATEPTAADTVTLAVLPSNARVIDILVANDDLETSTDGRYDYGVYNWTDTSGIGTALDQDCYVADSQHPQTAQGMSTVIDTPADATAIAKSHMRLWEASGQSSDPGGKLAIALTVATAPTTGITATYSYAILYVVT